MLKRKRWWIVGGLLLVGYLIMRQWTVPYQYSNSRAVAYLNKNAKSRSVNRCAQYVREAIVAGGCPTFGQPLSACNYSSFMKELGFEEINEVGYIPQAGDVVVFSRIKGHIHGHICMYNGRQWVSDFRQRSMYSAKAYRTHGTRTYWRKTDGRGWRGISIITILNSVRNLILAKDKKGIIRKSGQKVLDKLS